MHPQTVYELIDPATDKVMYVGATTRALRERLNDHVSAARNSQRPTPVSQWVRQVLARGEKPIIRAIVQLAPGSPEKFLDGQEDDYISQRRPPLNRRHGGRGTFLPSGTLAMHKRHAPPITTPILDTTTGITYPSISAAARSLGLIGRNIAEGLREPTGRYAGHARRFRRVTT